MFKIEGRIDFEGSYKITEHAIDDRSSRIEVYEKTFGQGRQVASFVVDTGHRNGKEIHVLTSTRLIKIYNQTTKKLITVLYARPAQIARYFNNAPMHLFDTYQQGFNQI
jgi:hypothetical protein